METITINLYAFNELTEQAKKKAIEYVKTILDDDFVYDIQDDIENYIRPEFINSKGFDADNVYYSLSYSQGDGAMFEGRVNDISKFTTNKRAIKVINEFGVYARFKHMGRYYHEKSYELTVDFPELKPTQYRLKEEFEKIEENIRDIYEETCKQIYKQIQSHYEFMLSDENAIEYINSNELTFTEKGEMHLSSNRTVDLGISSTH